MACKKVAPPFIFSLKKYPTAICEVSLLIFASLGELPYQLHSSNHI